MTGAERPLKKNRTDEAIIKALGKVCGKLPVRARDLCRAFVAQYLSQLMDLLLEKQPPEVVCEGLGMCPKQKRVDGEANRPVRCELCKKVAEEVKKLTKEALDKGCEFLPPLVKGACYLSN
jgi:hypothetical protein